MPVKRPPNGNSSGNTPIHQNTTPEVSTPHLDLPPRTNVEIPTPGGHSQRPGRLSAQADIDAIEPAATITVHSTPSSPDTPLPIDQTLEHYRLVAPPGLAEADD